MTLFPSVSTVGFTHNKFDHSLFIFHHGADTAYILLYVDDIILTASSDALRRHIMSLLSSEFDMKDLGPLSYFLGIAVTRHASGLFLSQRTYAEEIIERAGMSACAPVSTPVCFHMHDPRDEHLRALKRIVQYIQGTLSFGLHLYKSPASSLVSYSDADWGGCPDAVRAQDGPLLGILYSLGIISYRGRRNVNPLSHVPVPKPNIEGLLIGF
ncbi:uncharacterized mitochondrial protein AtMg00810-like [Spinacia oleracea]|uniref:Uncharacterized mitochondrial protein AtMg00810-like n=1 Tax=Spinacia oleracea TaxID=3562 RepID=A0A9R0K014_SPIOL|nr:uncharacterized mitochondrial protein AtMg00810-like [Spinacia oleracea]